MTGSGRNGDTPWSRGAEGENGETKKKERKGAKERVSECEMVSVKL
jgi:hypothetical protein